MMSLGKDTPFLAIFRPHPTPVVSTWAPKLLCDSRPQSRGGVPNPNPALESGLGWGGGALPTYAIYYYTPLPLNLANKQEATLPLSALAIIPSHRFGLYSTLTVLEPR